MGTLSAAGRQELDNDPNSNGNEGRSEPRPESPWLVDQRRAPRSVRTPPPYESNRSNNKHHNSQGPKRRQRSKSKYTNFFDSSSPTSKISPYDYRTTPASRNPSPSDNNRMLYTPSSKQAQRINPFGSSPSPRHASDNPFDSPDADRNKARIPFESPTLIKYNAGTNPLESPASTRTPQQRYHNSDANNGIVDDSSPYKVKVTVHTQQNRPPTPNKQQESAALDSLEQILDTTEETADEEDSDEVLEETGGNEGWSDEPYNTEQQREQQRGGGYYPQYRIDRQRQSRYPAHSNLDPSYLTPVSQLTAISLLSDSDDGTNTTATPSEKALRAAETLKKSFAQRRRQRATGTRNEATIHEEGRHQEKQKQHDDLVLEYSRTEEFGGLSGVAGKRRAEADARNTASEMENNRIMQVLQPELLVSQEQTTKGPAQAENGSEEQQQHNEGTNESNSNNGMDFTLHDLCDEAVDMDDLAWRNALYLLSVQPHLGRQVEPECKMTPLHVACLAQHPPPVWITHGLLYASPETCSQPDTGGRLPLHLLVATSAHIDTIRLLVEEYPPGVAHRDDRGFTPLQLLLKRNDSNGLTLEHIRLLLGQQMGGGQSQRIPNTRLMFRKGDHLKNDWVLRELETLADEREQKHESAFSKYPDDVRRALTKLSQWKRRQVNKQANRNTNSSFHRSDEEIHFLQSREADFITPASIPTPTGQLLPLHLLVRRDATTDATLSQDIHSIKRAMLIDSLRILIAAYPQGLVEVDANGKTPVMTAMLSSDTSPSEDVIELLLGLRTPVFHGKDGFIRPAFIATDDTFQMPLHVAAEELLSNYSLLTTICEAYPDARTVQDVRGRTPLHLALQNYRSTPVDEATLELLFVEPVANIKDNDGKRPLDLMLENPTCVIRESSQEHSSTILQEFFDASIVRPRNRYEAEAFLRKFQRFPPWLRRQACAARFVQDILVEEIATPFTTFRILGSGIVLVLLLSALRHMLHHDPNYTLLIYYLATYHFVMQIIHWGIALHMGQFIRICVLNIWRWIDLATVILSICCAAYVTRNIIDISDGAGTILLPLGASATISCWLSLLGFFVEWSCGLAVFVGSAFHLLSVLVWPLCIAAMGFFAASQVLFTLEDCTEGGICSLSEAYEFIYLTSIGNPVLTDTDYEVSTEIFVIALLFTILFLWWIVSVMAAIVSEASRLDRRQLSLTWYWEPKASLTVLTSAGNKNTKISESPSRVEQYCNISEKYWHIFSSALRGERSDVYWDAWCFRSTPTLIFTGFGALFILPIWFAMGFFTLGLLWPPQIRRWLFCPRPVGSTRVRKSTRGRPYGHSEEDLVKTKLSKLRSDLVDLKAITQDQSHQIQKDLGLIKDVIFRAIDGQE